MWVERAKRARVDDVLRKLGVTPKRDDLGGPCPCPSCVSVNKVSDRFSINRRKNVFFCRAAGAAGNAISLALHVHGSAFLEAVAFVTGESPPTGSRRESDTERAARVAKFERETRAAEARAIDAAETAERFRMDERARARDLWERTVPLAGTLTERYLAARGLTLPGNANVRHLERSKFWDKPPWQGGRVIHEGPCMAAAITAADGAFLGLHRTWIDLSTPKGKALVPDPETGEMLPAKKVRGSVLGGTIFLGGAARYQCRRVFMGEGIETTGSAYCALRDLEASSAAKRSSGAEGEVRSAAASLIEGARFCAAVTLGNMAGRAEKSVPHPTLRFTDKRGRVKPTRVPGPEPKRDDRDPCIVLPDGCEELYLIGDGDSEPFFTHNAMLRAGARFGRERPDLAVMLIKPPEGFDLNDLRLAVLGARSSAEGAAA